MEAGESSSGSGSKTQRGSRGPSPDPAARLTDDLLVEILSRVPHRSLCRFRCVSRNWRALIDHPDHRRTLPQSLLGFFHCSRPFAPTRYCFANVSGTGPPSIDASFPSLPDREREHLNVLDGCNGLLLCCSWRYSYQGRFDYLVLNPATEEWVAVPGSGPWSTSRVKTARLGFNLAVSSHFYLFEFDVDIHVVDGDVVGTGHAIGVIIYSSATGIWSHKQSGWRVELTLPANLKSVFLSGVLYVITEEGMVGAVDVEGNTWRIIDFPLCRIFTGAEFLGLSHSRLHFASAGDMAGDKLTIWVLEDNDGEEWTLKHTVCIKHLVGQNNCDFSFMVVALHPERNIVFFVSGDVRMLMSYDMYSGEVCSIRKFCYGRCIPYVPMFSKALADGKR